MRDKCVAALIPGFSTENKDAALGQLIMQLRGLLQISRDYIYKIKRRATFTKPLRKQPLLELEISFNKQAQVQTQVI